MEKKLFEAAATVSWHQRTTFACAQSFCKSTARCKAVQALSSKSEDSARTPTERDG